MAFREETNKPLMRLICFAVSQSKLNDCGVRRHLDVTRQGLASESDVRVLSGADQSNFQSWCFCRDNTPFMTKRTCLLKFRNERFLQGLMNCLIAQHFLRGKRTRSKTHSFIFCRFRVHKNSPPPECLLCIYSLHQPHISSTVDDNSVPAYLYKERRTR